jgi:dephospho-CoA kinase/inosine/xanthosine triphosphate pyrophosphatase family protein
MPGNDRVAIVELFYKADRRPEVHFYTSNIDKFLQARAVFERCGLILKHFATKTEPYQEDYSLGKTELLAVAVAQVRKSVGSNFIFFVEDTSIRIDALSEDAVDRPGLAAKEWFGETRFETLDAELKGRGNNRRATVKSDIALHVPGMSKPIYFHGETAGFVADQAPTFSASKAHPWLTPLTFNGWFVPDGAKKRLGEMSFEESLRFDFRIEALAALLERLEEFTAVLNLSPVAYSRKNAHATGQLSLLELRRQIFVVIGRTCAGKTTTCERLSAAHGFQFFEASSVFRSIAESLGLDRRKYANDHAFALEVFARVGNDAVARKMIEFLDGMRIERLAISGFRTIEELLCISDSFPESRTVLISASERTRYERRITRGRADEQLTFEEFNALDRAQWQLGLLGTAGDIADLHIENEGSLEDLYETVDQLVLGNPDASSAREMNKDRGDPESNQLRRCLEVLESFGRPLDCGEIEKATSQLGNRVRHNNANKVLKAAPELADRLEMSGARIRYSISKSGLAFLRLLEKKERS